MGLILGWFGQLEGVADRHAESADARERLFARLHEIIEDAESEEEAQRWRDKLAAFELLPDESIRTFADCSRETLEAVLGGHEPDEDDEERED